MKEGDKVEIKYATADPAIYENPGRKDIDQTTPLHVMHPIFERVEYPETGGVFAHFIGMPFPRKGFFTPQAVYANDLVKRFLMSAVNILGTKAMTMPMAGFAILPWKMKLKIIERALGEWTRFADYIYQPYYLKENRMSPCTRELWKIGTKFFKELGVNEAIAVSSARVFATMIEYDDAYRYRVEDLFSASFDVRSDAMDYPRKYIKFMQKTYQERERWDVVKTKFNAVFKILNLALLHPKVKAAWRWAFFDADWKAIMLDAGDTYHSLSWDNYDFRGHTLVERMELFKQYHPDGKYPPLVEIVKKY